MKLQVTQENLNKALASVARVANGHNTLPILSNILLKTTSNRLSVAATNLNIAITHLIGSKVSDEGSITVPARLTQDFISSLPSGVVDLQTDDNKLHITTNQYKSIINGASADDFPVMPAITDGQTWGVPTPALKKALQRVVFAASSDETRPVLTGIYLHTSENVLYMAGTDSYRLAEQKILSTKKPINILIPSLALQELLRLLDDEDSTVNITNDNQQALFRVGDKELVTRLIDGKYPDYQKLIPKEFATTASVDRTELLNITKVSSLFARESAGSVTVNVDEASQTISVQAVASQLGENTSTTTAKATGTDSITINARYLLDGLHALNSKQVDFCFNGKLEPSLLKGSAADDYLHIIMPLKS